jgi:hypothetical protein
MFTNIQQHFRYYLALVLSVLLAVGVRLQAAPLGTKSIATDEVTATQPPLPRGICHPEGRLLF